MSFDLSFNEKEEVKFITNKMRLTLSKQLHRRGFIVAVSGGIDSSVSAALAEKAVGREHMFALQLPERDSSLVTKNRGQLLVEHLDVPFQEFNISYVLESLDCYHWRDTAIKNIFPEYTYGWKNKIVISNNQTGQFNFFNLMVQSPSGETFTKRLDSKNYLQIVAATNFKQRVRKTMEYFHADRLNYAVIGTPNRLEYDQGFFVKNGDGSADIFPIAHLYKSQVYALARYLGLPDVICNATPTTDTYSLGQGQDEFYFALPYQKMDLALLGFNTGESAATLAEKLEISEEQAAFVYKDIETKRKTTAPLHWKSILMRDVTGPITVPPTL